MLYTYEPMTRARSVGVAVVSNPASSIVFTSLGMITSRGRSNIIMIFSLQKAFYYRYFDASFNFTRYSEPAQPNQEVHAVNKKEKDDVSGRKLSDDVFYDVAEGHSVSPLHVRKTAVNGVHCNGHHKVEPPVISNGAGDFQVSAGGCCISTTCCRLFVFLS